MKVFLLVSLCILPSIARDAPVVNVPLGVIQGFYDTTYNGRSYSAFYGIPYAKPPIGELRFKEPQPATPWKGVWIANMTSIYCAQISHDSVPTGGPYLGQEDCLYVNIFVPGKLSGKQNHLLDVIVHIHGGGFMFGSQTSYSGPKFLMDRDVVLVTLNYRVGILGFMSTGDEALPGNNGMKDQSMALRWIKENVKYFGANPDSITITGLSAGGASTHYHYLSPLSRGLFNRGISVSGVSLAPWTIQENPLEKARFIGEQVGCNQLDTRELVECMRSRNVKQLVEVIKLFRPWLFNPFSPLGLVVETAGDNKFLPEHPYVLLKKGLIYDVPWLTTLTSEEGLYPAADYVLNEKSLPELETNWRKFAPSVLDYNYTVPRHMHDKVSDMIKMEYLKGKPISRETYKQLIDMMSDRLFVLSSEMAAKLQAKATKSPVYFYYFSFLGDELDSLTIHFTGQDQNDGVSHGDDMMYIFSNPSANKPQKLTKPDKEMQKILIDMWIDYAKTGVPKVKNIDWLPVPKNPKEGLMQLHIHSPEEIFMEDADKIDRHRIMWASIPFEENEHLFPDMKRDEL